MLLIPLFVDAQDSLKFSSGTEYTCEVLSYEDGLFTVRLDTGAIKKAPAKQIARIQFAPNASPLEVKSAAPSDDTQDSAAFRNSTWGMTMDEVKASETLELVKEDENSLAYSDAVGGLDAFALYIFVQNRLVRTKYIFTEDHSNKNDYIDDFNAITSSLNSKYGPPVDEKRVWRNDLFKDDYSDWGRAVSIGHLVYNAKWETPETSIFHALYGDNYDITHVVEYSSKDLRGLEESERKSRDLNKL